MKKVNFKRIISVLIVLAIALCNFSILSFATTDKQFLSPVFCETPELLYEISKPNNTMNVYSDKFEPLLAETTPASGAPIISGITDNAAPNQSLVIEGKGFENATVWIYGTKYDGTTAAIEAEIVNLSDTTATVIVPETLAYGMYLVSVENASGLSYPVRVNAPNADWISNEKAEAGQAVTVYGKNLSYRNSTTVSYVYITDINGYETVVTPTAVNPYKVSFNMPADIANGNYEVWLHNGHGADYGWSNALSVTVESGVNNIWTGKTITIDKTDNSVSINNGAFSEGDSSNGYRLKINGEDLLINGSTTQTKVYTDGNVRSISYNSKNIPITINENSLIVNGNDQDLFEVAVCIAKNRDTIVIKNGEYALNRRIRVVQAVRFMGESKEATVINASFGNEVTASSVSANILFNVLTMPSEFSNLTFKDDIGSILSPGFIRADVYTETGTSNYVRDGFSQDGFNISNVDFIKYKTYTSESATGSYDFEGFQAPVTIDNGDGTTETFSVSRLIPECLYISSVNDVNIEGCYFKAPRGMSVRSGKGVNVVNNSAHGTWVMDGQSGPCFVQFHGSSNVNASGNSVSSYAKVLNPDSEIKQGAQTFDRVIVFQNAALENVYIADNTFNDCGVLNDNSGEQIMFESIGIAYQGKPTAVSQNSLTFQNTEWFTDESGVFYTSSDKSRKLLGLTVMVTKGEGISQYRKIVGISEENGVFTLNLDKAWDIVPTTASLIDIIRPFSNVTVYNNEINGLKDFNKLYNATAGIQAYGSMINLTVYGNKLSNLSSGILITARYHTSDDYTDFASADGAYFAGVTIQNNDIDNVIRGIAQLLTFRTTASFTDTTVEAMVEFNTVIRNNNISNAFYSEADNLIDIGGDGIAVGSRFKDYSVWGENKLPAGDYIKNTVIENNTVSNCTNTAIRLCYGQTDTILRENSFADNAKLIEYDQSAISGAPIPDMVIEYNSPSNPRSIYGKITDGITKTTGNELNSIYIDAADMTTDFSEGLRYWGAKGSLKGTASEYASVENGELAIKFHETNPANYDGIQSVRMYIPEYARGKEIGFICDVERTTQFGIQLNTQSGKRANYNYSSKAIQTGWYPTSGSVVCTETDTYMYFVMQVNTVADKLSDSFKVRNLHVGYVNDEGIFVEFNSGELWNKSYGYNTPYYGTVEDGIYTKNNKGVADQNLVPLNNLTNANFSEGLKYWGTYNITDDSYASDIAKVENGELKITASADANSYYHIMSAPVAIPEGLVGKNLGMAFYVDSPNNQFATGFRTDAGGSLDGSSFGARSAQRVKASVGNNGYVITENDKAVSVYVKQFNQGEASHGGVTTIDDVILFWYDPADTSVGYTFDGQKITFGNVNYYTYGTEEKGIYTASNSETQGKAHTLNNVYNLDFSEGLKYWGGSSFLRGYASKDAVIENGMATITSHGSYSSALTTAPMPVNAEWIGKTMHAFFKVRTSGTNIGYSFRVWSEFENNTTTYKSWSAGNDVKGSESLVSKEITFTFTEEAEVFYINHQVGIKTEGAYIQVADFVLAYENEDGTLTSVMNGEQLNKYGYPIYGTEKDGIYSGTAQGIMGETIPALSKPMNLNFAEGLKYWSSYNVKNTFASDTAKVENGELVITATVEEGKTSYYNVISAGVAIPENMIGKKLCMTFMMNSPNASVGATIHTNAENNYSYTFSARTARTGLTSNLNTVTAEDTVAYIRFQQNGTAGAVSKIDDIVLFYHDVENNKYYDFNGEPVTLNDVYYNTYGTVEKGIYVGSTSKMPVKNIAAVDEFTNFDFSEGLKYWGSSSTKYSYASDLASVENGKIKLSDSATQTYCGIRSVSFKLPEAAKGNSVVVNYDISSNVKFAVKVHTNTASSNWLSKNSTNTITENVTTTTYAIAEDAGTIAIEMQIYGDTANPTHFAYIDNISIRIADDGGIENLYASLEGAPIGYDYGDVNADTKVDVRDLVRAKKYLAGISTPIYKAAANADKDSNMSVGATDLTAIAKIILGVN